MNQLHMNEKAEILKLSEHLRNRLSTNAAYLEALDIVRMNSAGKIWLIGSGVYKTLLNILRGRSYIIKDWDFIAEDVASPLSLHEGWEVGSSRYGSPKLKKGELVIDLVPLKRVYHIEARKLEPRIEHYLCGTPLTVHSIVFDVDTCELSGDAGIRSALTGRVGIHHQLNYEHATKVSGDHFTLARAAKMLGLKIEY